MILTEDALHVQPLDPRGGHTTRFFAPLGFAFFDEAWPAIALLDAKKAGRMLGVFDASQPLERRRMRAATPEEILGLTQYRFPLRKLRRIEVGERFPSLSVEVLGPSFRRESYDLTPDLPPWVAGPPTNEMRSYARSVATLLDAAHGRGWSCELEAGWLELPAVEWEPASFPSDDDRGLPTYRSAPEQQKRIEAERGPGDLFERLVRQLLPRAKGSPSRVVLTREDVFAEFVGIGVRHLPRGLPRWSDGRSVVFGRWAGMRLEPRDAPCPVAERLIDEPPEGA